MTERDAITRAFTDLAAKYEQAVDDELQRFWGYSYRGFLEWLLEMVPLRQGGAVLDLATGTALLPRLLASRLPGLARIIGLDITPAMLAQAGSLLASEEDRSGIALICASAMDIPLADDSMDVAICALGTHHMDAERLVSEMRRVTRAGGLLLVADVAASPWWGLPGLRVALRGLAYLYFLLASGRDRAWAESEAVSHVRTVDEWRGILSQHGLADVRVVLPRKGRFWSPIPFAILATKTPQCADGGGGC